MSVKWTETELNLVDKLKAQGKTVKEIADILSRPYDSVSHKFKQSKTKPPKAPKVEQKQSKKELSSVLNQQLKDELENITPYNIVPQTKVDIKGDTLVIHLTDLHAGKIVKDQDGLTIYNEVIFKERIDRLCEQALKLLDNNISKSVPITNVAIISTGDLANGEGIYATQAYEQEIAPPAQVMSVVGVISKLIVSLLNRGLSVEFYGVRGNHGRTGKDTDVASNWDLMIYMILDFWAKAVLKNPKLQIKYAETEHMIFRIRNHGIMITHIAPEQVDSPAGRVKINQWARRHDVDIIIYGHYHHAGIFDCDNVKVIRGGSTVGPDALSDSMSKYSEPKQVVFGINEKRTTTFIYLLDLG